MFDRLASLPTPILDAEEALAPPRRQPARPERRTKQQHQATSARLEELRDTAAQIIERTLTQQFQLARPNTAAEGERIRGLYAPLLVDLQQRARAAASLEELDEVMARHARLADLLEQEARHLAAQERREAGSAGK